LLQVGPQQFLQRTGRWRGRFGRHGVFGGWWRGVFIRFARRFLSSRPRNALRTCSDKFAAVLNRAGRVKRSSPDDKRAQCGDQRWVVLLRMRIGHRSQDGAFFLDEDVARQSRLARGVEFEFGDRFLLLWRDESVTQAENADV
ncbi:MAG TPA: hypothetical protein PKA11_13025, partial [Accumulibacter sp.]|nr:hypothetical protein [Accumulibacter sp.]